MRVMIKCVFPVEADKAAIRDGKVEKVFNNASGSRDRQTLVVAIEPAQRLLLEHSRPAHRSFQPALRSPSSKWA